MSASIGGYSFDTWTGQLVSGWGKPVVTTYSRDGVDGLGIEVSAWRQTPVRILTHVETSSNPATIADEYSALIGTVCNAVDSFGTTWEGVTVVDCVVEYFRTVAGTFLIRADWRLIPKI